MKATAPDTLDSHYGARYQRRSFVETDQTKGTLLALHYVYDSVTSQKHSGTRDLAQIRREINARNVDYCHSLATAYVAVPIPGLNSDFAWVVVENRRDAGYEASGNISQVSPKGIAHELAEWANRNQPRWSMSYRDIFLAATRAAR